MIEGRSEGRDGQRFGRERRGREPPRRRETVSAAVKDAASRHRGDGSQSMGRDHLRRGRRRRGRRRREGPPPRRRATASAAGKNAARPNAKRGLGAMTAREVVARVAI